MELNGKQRSKFRGVLFATMLIAISLTSTRLAQANDGSDWLKSVNPSHKIITKPKKITTHKKKRRTTRRRRKRKKCLSVNSRKFMRGYHVQIGALPSISEAEERIVYAMTEASDQLEGHQSIISTVKVPASTDLPKRTLYRARFIGFSRDAAYEACDYLSQQEIPCAPMKARSVRQGCRLR